MSSAPERIPKKVLLSWSSGKDSAWTLHVLRRDPRYEVCGLITSINETNDRVAIHGVRRSLLEAQAASADLPLTLVPIPHRCSNATYEAAMDVALAREAERGIETLAFGDLYLEDIRAYRKQQAERIGLEPVFPLWKRETRALAREMIDAGTRAIITCVDPRRCPATWAGRPFDATLLDELDELGDPIDPCGENGEFHTFAFAGPALRSPIAVTSGEIVERDDFVFADLRPAPARTNEAIQCGPSSTTPTDRTA